MAMEAGSASSLLGALQGASSSWDIRTPLFWHRTRNFKLVGGMATTVSTAATTT